MPHPTPLGTPSRIFAKFKCFTVLEQVFRRTFCLSGSDKYRGVIYRWKALYVYISMKQKALIRVSIFPTQQSRKPCKGRGNPTCYDGFPKETQIFRVISSPGVFIISNSIYEKLFFVQKFLCFYMQQLLGGGQFNLCIFQKRTLPCLPQHLFSARLQ